jgi:hypothetical protein
MAGSSPLLQEIAWSARRDGARSQEVEMQVAIGVLVRRDYASAARRFAAAAAAGGPETTRARMYQAFALLTMGGNDRTGIDAGRISRY